MKTVLESKRMARVLGAITMAAALLLLSPPPARAYRPFTGSDAGVASLDKLEVEFGPLGYSRTGDERVLVGPELELTYGAGSGYQFGAGARRLTLMSPDADRVKPRIDDIELTVGRLLKAGSLQDKGGLSIVTEGALLIPPSTRHRLGVGLLLAASQSWDDAAVHVSGGVSKTREGETGRFASLIAEGPDRWELRPVAEGSLEREAEETTLRALLLGFIWQTRTGLAMDFAFRIGYSDERLAEFRSGITWNRHVSGPRMP